MIGNLLPAEWKLPTTRYQGSKRKLIPWIYGRIKDLEFESALDVFGGTGVVSYLIKKMGKRVTYNDYLKFNYVIGKAIVENSEVVLTENDVEWLLQFDERNRSTFVKDTFEGKYYTDDENRWIDCIVGSIKRLRERYSGNELEYKESLAYYALFESCLVKRPFNLFHRSNLYLRVNEVERTFGNKTSWEKPFELLFRRFVDEANGLVFSNGERNKAINKDALSLHSGDYGLVYIDPPYFCEKRHASQCDYGKMYHFLEGLARYEEWESLIDYESPNLHLKNNSGTWLEKGLALQNLGELFKRFRNSIIVVSYKSPGIPTEGEIVGLMRQYKNRVSVERVGYSYALNKSNGNPHENIELLILGE